MNHRDETIFKPDIILLNFLLNLLVFLCLALAANEQGKSI
jgi:hypothetical protein